MRFSLLCCICLAVCSLQAIAGRDYYDLLQVPRGASEAVIKRSFRKLALKYHPDKVTGTDKEKEAASKTFTEISHAYEVLVDPEQRKIYDRYGEEGVKEHAGQKASGRQPGGNIFDMFFGGGGFGGFGGFGMGDEEEEELKGHTINIDLYVTLKDLYIGRELKVMRDKVVLKPGSGTRNCRCKQKLVTRQLGPGMFQQYSKQVCEQCQAVRQERQQEELTVHVEPGMVEQQTITFFEEGEPLVDGEPGDLQFVVRTLPNAQWERRGHDLLVNQTISLVDALTGFTKTLKHLDDHEVTLSATGVTRPGDYHYIKGEGMPHFDDELRKGDLWVQYSVSFPAELTESQKETIKSLFPR
uniref:J domain-containing protein n=1 Tax=Dunaliella tertiolecta TaxID=3047 RepID=A0A7S3VIA0_DUNTE|mmetsp:Transcript_14470/g.39189  ORF Transcript_14470/g.39189 Transcript_14470/m.39189 type:complete len:355 (+) Transcript_14470:96-1160(+)